MTSGKEVQFHHGEQNRSVVPLVKSLSRKQGILPGWWLGDKDGRLDEPYISAERWDKDLREAGFSQTDSVVYDDDLPYQINANIVCKPADVVDYSKKVTILRDHEPSVFSRQVAEYFINSGYTVTLSTIDQKPPTDQDVISLLDLTAPFFDEISSQQLSAFQTSVGQVTSSGILWVTRTAQLGCKDPRYGQSLGVARTVRSELLIDFATLEIDEVDDKALSAISQVFEKFRRRSKGPDYDPDWEYASYDCFLQIPSYDCIYVPDALSVPMSEELPRRLETHKPGQLQSLRWVQQSPNELMSDDVEVETRAVGLNFKVRSIRMLGTINSKISLGCSNNYGSGRRNKGGNWLGRLRHCSPHRFSRQGFDNR